MVFNCSIDFRQITEFEPSGSHENILSGVVLCEFLNDCIEKARHHASISDLLGDD